MATTQHREFLQSLGIDVLQAKNMAELSKMATDFCGYFVSPHAVQNAKKRILASAGIIKEESTLTQEANMRDATEMEQARIERLLKQNGYRPQWGIAWAHLEDAGVKTTVLLKNPADAQREEDWEAQLLANIKKKAPKYPTLKPRALKDKHMHLIDIADLHLGKDDLTHSYSLEFARATVERAVQSLIDRGSGYNIDQFVLPVGNDVLHVDGKNNTTTGGTPQQVNSHWTEMWEAGFNMYVAVIERLGQIAPVHVVYNRANHSEHLEWTLVKAVQARMSGMQQVTWDISRLDRACYVYGKNFIGTVHGDKAKLDKLPHLFAVDFRKEWGQTDHSEIMVHHVHHGSETVFKPAKDYPGTRVNTLRSLSPTDDWHHDAGYVGVPRSIESFVFHKEQGRLAHLICPY